MIPPRPASIRYQFLPIREVLVSVPAAQAVVEQAEQRNARRVLILASQTLHQTTQVTGDISRALGDRCAGVIADIGSHTPRHQVLRALQQARQQRVDLLVAVGGGSIIDAAKVIQLGLNHGLASEPQLLQHARTGDGGRGPCYGRVPDVAAVRQIAVPTTLSGAEFSANGNTSDPVTGIKEGYRYPELCPDTIIYDPAITCHTPEWLWLSTGIRALDHAVEGVCDARCHPFIEGQLLHGMGLLARSLPQVKADPTSLPARTLNQQALWLACAGLGRVSHGASHGIGYILGSLCGVAHGYTSCVMLPAVLEWNSAVNSDRQRAVAAALGGENQSAAARIKALVRDLGLPVSLKALDIPRTRLPEIARAAANHKVVQNNPRPIAGVANVMEVLEIAFNG